MTDRTARRRETGRTGFEAFCEGHTPTVEHLVEYAEMTWTAISNRHTNVTTLIAECRRRNNPIQGDTAGYVRELQKQLTQHKPDRAQPAAQRQIRDIIEKITDTECATILALCWACAARLTSCIGLLRSDINEVVRRHEMTELTITFRVGKTVLATGAYSVRTNLPNKYADWLLQHDTSMFNHTPEYYYKKLRPHLRPAGLEIKSLRRGALQTLALMGFPPEEVLLISRHTTVKGLYAYLDDGRHAAWETTRTAQLTTHLWDDSCE